MNLVIDIGNSAVKYGLFENDRLIKAGYFQTGRIHDFRAILAPYKVVSILLSSVANLPEGLIEVLNTLAPLKELDENTAIPIKNAYLSPGTLGRDRLCNACAAQHLFPENEVLIIDVGTCLKFDFVDRQGVYSGGAISPGLMMRFRALHHFTARLPLLDPVTNPHLIGRNTEESIQSGVVNGMTAEIEGIIKQYNEVYSRLQLILTGGDAGFFLNQLKSCIFVAPELTLQGLNQILLFQSHDKN